MDMETTTSSKVMEDAKENLKVKDPESVNKLTEKILAFQNFVRIQNACKDAQLNAKMVGITGDPGLGKTTALENYFDKTKNVYVVRVRPSMNTKQLWLSVLKEITFIRQNVFERMKSEAIDWDDNSKVEWFYGYKEWYDRSNSAYDDLRRNNETLHAIINAIIELLNTQAQHTKHNNLLVFEETGKFKTPSQLEFIHEIRDSTLKSTGIIMAGPPYWQKKLLNWANRGADGIPELMSRVNYWVALERPDPYEKKQMCKAYGISDPGVVNELIKSNHNFRSLYNDIVEYLSSANAN